SFKTFSHANIALSPLIILLFSCSFIPVIAKSGFPPHFFGLSLRNWKEALAYSMKASAVFLLVFIFLELLLVNASPAFADMSLISAAAAAKDEGTSAGSALYWVALIVYLLLTPMQEFVARSGIQAPLYAFLNGSDSKRRWVSILVSNMVFTAAH